MDLRLHLVAHLQVYMLLLLMLGLGLLGIERKRAGALLLDYVTGHEDWRVREESCVVYFVL
jgi:hypothetical protein